MELDEGPPVAYRAVALGAPVFAAAGERVGWLVQVLDNPAEDIFDGIVIQTSEGLRFVDAPEVGSCAERAIHLRVAAADVATLPEPSPGLPVRREPEPPPPNWSPPPQQRYLRAFGPASAVLMTAVYAILGSQLPSIMYGVGLAVCVVLLVLWFTRWRRGR